MPIQTNNLVFYQTENADVVVNVVYKDETFWLSQKAMAALFDVNTQAITKHLSNIYEEQELVKDSTCSILEQVQKEGNRNVKRSVEFYNLDAIIAVGYRVNSKKATKFRQWATKTLREYITKGFVLNEKLLKNGKQFGQDYFDELLEKIREIRASERRAYQKITDIFEQCSCDYDKDSETTKNFYAFVQNKLHFAVSGNTAAEIVYNRADSQKEHMGLTSWKNSPNGKIYKSDVTIAKNYLNEKEISRLNRLVTMFIDYAELQAEDGNLMKMQDCVDAVNMFLQSNRQKVLESKGKISHEQAIEKAHHEYEIFRVIQDREYISEFDRQTKRIEEDSK
ncbi:MAG: virulence RhuM family protein [Treponema sp.]|nr:virulence RhuM family protein [Treponema sp.]